MEPDRITKVAPSLSTVRLSARNVSMPALAELLTTFGVGPVVDKTNIEGTYDFSLTYGIDGLSAAAKKAKVSSTFEETTAPSIFAALRKQLGLKLQAQKVRMDYLVIDSVEKPGVN
jgi:uncharacterized protein (TIGR03435 family)